ncbi:Up-regulated during septation-domain-containing protein [Aspergillus egyptiacus]|nr:Up-regulated during septation-domain-containing protein [Aspergillus egyptiacus]
MGALDPRSSQSSYGDPGHFSSASFGAPQPPPTKVLLEGYRDAPGPHNAEKSLYNPLSATQPRNSIPVSANDPVAMYLLTETAMGDSMNYEILSLEEVEGFKKDLRVLSSRMKAAKRKLTLEMKLRDAATSLRRLHNGKSVRTSEEYSTEAALESRAAESNNTDEELALSNRKCEELAMEIWYHERKVQDIQRKLLEHTAGVLQLTHKGLKKNVKNGIPHTPESLSSINTLDEFDDRSLYKTSDHLEGSDGYGTRASPSDSLIHDTLQETERKLEILSGRVRDMLMQSDADSEFGQLPQASDQDTSANPSQMVDAHLKYIENGLMALNSQPRADAPSQGLDTVSERQLVDMGAQLLSILENPGLPGSQILPPAPGSSSDLAEHLTYLGHGMNGLEGRIEKLLEQKSILTTQIQQQRELNSKSDAERDARIADLIEQIAHLRKELELSERHGQKSREDLELITRELEDVRRELSESLETQNSKDLAHVDQEAHERAEAEITRLENVIEKAQREKDEHHEARVRAEGEVTRLQALAAQLQDATEARGNAEQQVSQLEETLQQIRNDADIRIKEATDTREQADAEIAQLTESMGQLREELESLESKLKEATEARTHAEESASRLQGELTALEGDIVRAREDLKEATEARTHAEQSSARLQEELTALESDVVRTQTELTMVKAELDGAYGTRAQRAAEAAADPALFRELDELKTRNFEMAEELAALKAGRPGSSDVKNRVETLEKELRETVDDYEAMTKASIEFEKERERFESMIDALRDRCEQLETQLNEERISWMGSHNSASSMGRDGPYETTSTMVLKNEFKKMMRDTRTENMKILKAEQEERRKLEAIIRTLKKEQANMSSKPSLSQSVTAL